MIRHQALCVADALTGRARQLLRQLEIGGQVTLEAAEAKEFAAELIDIARAVIAGGEAEIIDLAMRRRLQIALATPGDGDAA